jgi:hypothetical protein
VLPSPPSPAATAPALDLKALEQRLRDTHAIGVFTKLSLKNQVDDLLAQFKTFYRGRSQITLAQLRQKYEVLLMKAVSVLQDNDPNWRVLILPAKRLEIWRTQSRLQHLINHKVTMLALSSRLLGPHVARRKCLCR